MDGTTLCPHCNTRFRIAGTQLDAHQGMVRCGHCMQAFDARPGFIPDQPDPQLELPIVDQRVAPPAAPQPESAEPAAPPAVPQAEADPVAETSAKGEPVEPAAIANPAEQEPAKDETVAEPVPAENVQAEPAATEFPHDASLDFVPPAANDPSSDEAKPDEAKPPLVIAPVPLAGGDTEVAEGEEALPVPPKRRWPWIVASSLFALLLLLQGLYFFRVELAARLPGLKPALVGYCKLLDCSVPLPQNPDLMSIESSELEADPEHANQITLVALLRNRSAHVQAFPVLELSLNDTEDKVLARRQFKPADYLLATESEAAGLRPNRELNIRLKLDTTDLRPTGYRLALFYPQ